MANALNAVRYNARMYHTPSEILKATNNDLNERNPEQLFVTAFLGVLNITTGRLEYSNAGHNPPVLIKRGQLTQLTEAGNLVLGLFADEEYVQASVCLEPT